MIGSRHSSGIILLGCAVLSVLTGPNAGCNGKQAALEDSARLTRIQALEDKVAQQAQEIVRKDEMIRDQAEVIQSLRGLEGNRLLENLIHVSSIEIDQLSGGFDRDDDGVSNGVVVYLRLYDQYRGSMRATGHMNVRLYDLALPVGRQLVGEKVLEPADLEPLWHGRFMTSHYTIRIPWAGNAPRAAHEAILVDVSFTDLLSGRTFGTQRTVSVRGAAPQETAQAAPKG